MRGFLFPIYCLYIGVNNFVIRTKLITLLITFFPKPFFVCLFFYFCNVIKSNKIYEMEIQRWRASFVPQIGKQQGLRGALCCHCRAKGLQGSLRHLPKIGGQTHSQRCFQRGYKKVS